MLQRDTYGLIPRARSDNMQTLSLRSERATASKSWNNSPKWTIWPAWPGTKADPSRSKSKGLFRTSAAYIFIFSEDFGSWPSLHFNSLSPLFFLAFLVLYCIKKKGLGGIQRTSQACFSTHTTVLLSLFLPLFLAQGSLQFNSIQRPEKILRIILKAGMWKTNKAVNQIYK